MKGIIKNRSFDSFKKLSFKRALGKRKYISNLDTSIYTSIRTLETLQLLTPELLWELIQKRMRVKEEIQKLNYVISCREYKKEMNEEAAIDFVYRLANLKLPTLNIPYELRDKYSKYILDKCK